MSAPGMGRSVADQVGEELIIMSDNITPPAAKIRLQGVGWMPAVEARDLVVGDTIMWNYGYTSKVLDIKDVSPAFLRLTLRDRDGGVNERRMKKAGRSVARVAQAQPQEAVSAPCETIGCKAAATHLLSYPDRDSGTVYSDKVCKPCGESFTRRPALRATLAPLGSE